MKFGANLAMAPKKKSAFFNGGLGVDVSAYNDDIGSHERSRHSSEQDELYIIASPKALPKASPTGCLFSINRPSISHSPPTPISPPPTSPLIYDGYSVAPIPPFPLPYPTPTYPDPANIGATGYPPILDYCGTSMPINHHDIPGVSESLMRGDGLHDPFRGLDSDDINSKKKRQQRCRLCANHGVTVEVKGHKWYCPKRDCTCNDCYITRQRQYYMKEQQKLTRHQQQQQNQETADHILPHFSHGGHPQSPQISPPSPSPDTNPLEFPRLAELERETRDIIDEDLFARINQVCRPRAHVQQ